MLHPFWNSLCVFVGLLKKKLLMCIEFNDRSDENLRFNNND